MTSASGDDTRLPGLDGAQAHLDVPARRESMPRVLAFVDAFCRERGLAADIAFDARLAIDEICTNVIEHGYRDLPPGPIALDIAVHPDRLVIGIADRGRAFDPRSASPPDLLSPIERREVGGLGCHLVRSVMDAIDYRSTDGENFLTLTKLMPGKA